MTQFQQAGRSSLENCLWAVGKAVGVDEACLHFSSPIHLQYMLSR